MKYAGLRRKRRYTIVSCRQDGINNYARVCVHACVRVFVCVFFWGRLGKKAFTHTKMLCRTRPFLVIPTKTSLLVLHRATPTVIPPAGTAVRHYFAEGSRSLSGPLHYLALVWTASSSLFSSS